jgi:integrase
VDRHRHRSAGPRAQAPRPRRDAQHPHLAVPVELLRDHLKRYGAGPGGRVFRTARGGPVGDASYGQVWHRARAAAHTAAQQASPLARRPYDVRHAAVSPWLNAGVLATEVARCAGHGVAVLLKVYANCVERQDTAANHLIGGALESPGS